MRYSVIAPLITGLSDEYDSLEAFYRNASAKRVTHPDGTLKHYAPGTIEKWYRNYNQHGFGALVPTGRADLGKPRKLDDELQEQIRHEPLKQRIVMNYNLEGLTKDEAHLYVSEKLKGAGCNQTVFEEAAVEAVINAADGIPRITCCIFVTIRVYLL